LKEKCFADNKTDPLPSGWGRGRLYRRIEDRRKSMEFFEKISPAHTALIVIDLQCDYFCEGGIIDLMGFSYESMKGILPSLKGFIESSRKYVKKVVFTRQTMYPYLRSPVVVEHYTRAKMIRPFNPRNENFFEITPAPEDVILPKHRYSAFIGTHFDALLRANGIKTMILIGVATNVCVESTARDGFMMDYHIVVPSDLTAGVNDQVKEMSLYNIGTFFGEVVKSEYILKTWEKYSQGNSPS
jgi:ureidoacrylate peracid hydrolase